MGTRNETKADRKRVKNETGLRSPSTGVLVMTRRSGEEDFAGSAGEVGSNFSDGFGSSSERVLTRRLGEGDFAGSAGEVESTVSDGLGSSSERRPLDGEETFSLLASVVDMVDTARRDGRRLGNEEGTEGVEHVHERPASISMP
jgi:hypothetical protein